MKNLQVKFPVGGDEGDKEFIYLIVTAGNEGNKEFIYLMATLFIS